MKKPVFTHLEAAALFIALALLSFTAGHQVATAAGCGP